MAAIPLAYAQESKLITNIDDFNEIELNVSADVRVTIGNEFSIELEGSQERIDNTLIERHGDTLEINSKRSGFSWFGFGRGAKGSLDISVTMPDIETMTVNGSGNAEIVNVDNDELELKVHGSGDIFVGGKSKEVAIQVHGSGDVEMSEVAGETVDIEIHGSGNVDIENGTCTEMEIDIHGSGDVHAKDLICQEVSVDVQGSGNSMVHATELLKFDGSGSGNVDAFGKPKTVIDEYARKNSKIHIR